ncbi:MAG: GtrA family protein [Halobacteriaceae archaeon]
MSDGLAALLSGKRAGKFVSVGVAGFSLETVVVAILTAGFTVDPLVAKAVGAEASISLMFLLNDRWTFATEGHQRWTNVFRRYLRSHLVRAGGLAVAFLVLWLLTDYTEVTLRIGGADFWPTVANGVGVAAGMAVNYVAESLFTWQVHR